MKELAFSNGLFIGICLLICVQAGNELNGGSASSKTAVVKPEVQPVYIMAGAPLQLICEQDEGLQVQWLKDNTVLDTSGSKFFTTQKSTGDKVQSTLTADQADESDTALFACQPEGKPEDAYNINVFVFEIEPIHGHAKKDREDISLGCKIDGVDAGKLTWQREGSEIVETSGKYTIETENNTLTVIRASEGDEGEYSCVLNLNNGEQYNETVYLYMLPQVNKFQKSKNVIQGDPLQLECKAFGYPTPSVSWYKDETPLDTSDSRMTLSDLTTDEGIVLSNATLRIENIDFPDRADYACVATYGDNANNATVLVRVKDKLAALWPFLGICAEVTILCVIIFIYEKRRAKKMEAEEAQEEADHLTNSHANRGNDEIRQRK